MSTSLSFRTVLFSIVLYALLSPELFAQKDWETYFERSGGVATPDYAETMQYLRRLDSASSWIQLSSFGVTPQGRELPLVVLARNGEFTPAAARASGKDIVLIQAGIHSGEIDGKDACLMLLREIAITRSLEELANSTIILFMPIFNLDGHERNGPYNRINQNGPEEMGWRTTAQNLNLNRDYLKADAPEMRAWLRTFNAWMPDMLVDLHVTDGIDFQYNLTYAMEVHGNMSPPVTSWEHELADFCIAGMETLGDPIAPYTWPRERSDISKGIIDWASPPRLSTGYAAVRNRANMLVETHMMKPYKDRVLATYRMLELVLRHINTQPGSLHAAVREADELDIELFSRKDTTAIPVQFRSSGSTQNFVFKGYASEMRRSPISGDEHVTWDHSRPIEVEVPFLDDVQPTTWVTSPRAYLIPQEWTAVLDVLRLHGVQLQRLTENATREVETTVFSNPKWRDRPYEGRFTVNADQQRRLDTIAFPAGTYMVEMAQPSARAALHLLEPQAPDSFVFWGFFNAIFEKKEYFEDYVMAEMALKMHEESPALRREFAQKLASDSAFAASPRERLNFFYERSPYFDDHMNVYPVRRLLSAPMFPAVREEEYR